jgi:hypothetical protein
MPNRVDGDDLVLNSDAAAPQERFCGAQLEAAPWAVIDCTFRHDPARPARTRNIEEEADNWSALHRLR